MRFFYASGARGFIGEGYVWHKWFKFPDYPIVTKTFTRNNRRGCPVCVLPLPMFDSVWNKYGLNNPGFYSVVRCIAADQRCVISLHGKNDEIIEMVKHLNERCYDTCTGIELNYSCPNVKSPNNMCIPRSHKLPLYLKLNCEQDPYLFETELDRITGICLNSVPLRFGALSGKLAQKKNWEWIKKHKSLMEYIPIAGVSWTCYEDILRLQDMGCTEFAIGTVTMTNPRLVESLPEIFPDANVDG